MINNSSIMLFGIASVKLEFDCAQCGQRVETNEEIEVPSPDFSAETSHDSQNENEGYAICETCGEHYEIDLINGYGGGYIWVKGLADNAEIEVKEIAETLDYETEAILSNSEFKETFDMSIDKIRNLNELLIPSKVIGQFLKNNLYVSIVASMETYLSDAFINTIDKKNEKYLRQFVDCFKKYQERKIKLSELYFFYDSIKTDVIKDLKDTTFHNIVQSKYFYGKALKINFPEELSGLLSIVEKRHDIIHRNGKTKEGPEVILSTSEVNRAIKTVTEFINFIDIQILELE